MEIPENYFLLYLIGIADKPGPVLMNIYLDAQYIGQMSFSNNDNHRHLSIKDFNVPSIKAPHPHAITVEFANDYYAGPGDGDRNFYLDLLAVTD